MFRRCTGLAAALVQSLVRFLVRFLALPLARVFALVLSLASCLASSLAAQPQECLGHDLNDPGQRLPLLSPTHTWTLYNLGPGRVVIRASTGQTLPGPAPESDPSPTRFRGETGTSYTLSLEAPGLTIVYICPGP